MHFYQSYRLKAGDLMKISKSNSTYMSAYPKIRIGDLKYKYYMPIKYNFKRAKNYVCVLFGESSDNANTIYC